MHNNSINIILLKNCKIWSFNITLNLVLSLKTEMKDEMKSLTALHFYHIFNNSFIPCLCHLFMTDLNNECVWTELQNWLNENVCLNYFWFNIPLQAIKSFLDNINQISEFKQCIHLQLSDKHDCKETTDVMLIITFYFELIKTLINKVS